MYVRYRTRPACSDAHNRGYNNVYGCVTLTEAKDRCRAVIERYGLTEREGEIMIMFAKGRNLPYVQEELCLSKSTVSTHRQHIYQKLGVHSAQEMIDLIQKENG